MRDVPGPLDLAVITAPAEACPQVLLECGARGVRFAVVFSSGFSEIGPEGAALERELAAAARRAGVRVLGPNTNNNLLERIPDPPGWRGGRIGVVTQSGHNGRPIVQGTALGIGFRRQIPCGNECDLEISDFIDYFASDPETAVIAGYIEGFRDGAKLRRALAAAIAARKPVVMLKIGSTRGGARMAHSHTGHLAGADAVVDGLFAQHAVTRVRDLDELLDTAALFAKLPPGDGRARRRSTASRAARGRSWRSAPSSRASRCRAWPRRPWRSCASTCPATSPWTTRSTTARCSSSRTRPRCARRCST